MDMERTVGLRVHETTSKQIDGNIEHHSTWDHERRRNLVDSRRAQRNRPHDCLLHEAEPVMRA